MILEIIIREMKDDEAQTVMKIAKKTFSALESLLVSKPKTALVAEVDSKIVGGITYKIIKTNYRKTGYIDQAFILPEYQGKGIGSKLYKETFDYLQEHGCDTLSALVKDDNVASWGLFLKNGFHRANIIEVAKKFGIIGFLKHYFSTPWFVAIGMDYYVATNPPAQQNINQKTSLNIASFLLFNAIAVLIAFLIYPHHSTDFVLAYIAVLITFVVTGYMGTLLTKRKWKFRFTDGGLIFTVLNSLIGGTFPAIGNWYPNKYEDTSDFRKDMGIVSIVSWVVTIILVLLPILLNSDNRLLISTSKISEIFLGIRIITIYPASAFGGMRVYDWNKFVWGALVIVSILVIWL